MFLRRLPHPIPALLLLALLLPASSTLAAQAVLTDGTPAQGELRKGDLKLDDDTYADLWRFTARAGQNVRVSMKSGDFDAYLVVGYYDAAGEFKQLDSDDDDGDGTDALIELTVSRSGEFIARANTLEEGETGSYTLLFETGGAGTPRPLAGGGNRTPISAGQTLAGELKSGDQVETDGTFADFYVYTARAGERATVTLRSGDFDAYLAIRAPNSGSGRGLEANDDGAGGHDSRISYTFPTAGEYWLVANVLTKATGRYTISVESSSSSSAAASSSTASSLVIDKINGQGGAARPATSAPQPSAAGTTAQPIQPGQTVRGELSRSDELNFDNTYVDTYTFHGRQGQKVRLLMMSAEFGSYLLVGKAPASGIGREFSSIETVGSMAGKEAQLEITLPEEGDFWIRANSFGVNTGSYVLTFQSAN